MLIFNFKYNMEIQTFESKVYIYLYQLYGCNPNHVDSLLEDIKVNYIMIDIKVNCIISQNYLHAVNVGLESWKKANGW